MITLVTYDVRTLDTEGCRRLRRVARICMSYGIRVQMSVFECRITPSQRVELEASLRAAIDPEVDSLRLYDLGSTPSGITHIGAKKPLDPDDILMF